MEQAFIMIVSNFVFVEGLKVFQIYPLVMRYLVSPFVVSQKRKDALWAPPRMLLGDLYAGAVKTVALCLICKSPPHSNVGGSQTSNGLTPFSPRALSQTPHSCPSHTCSPALPFSRPSGAPSLRWCFGTASPNVESKACLCGPASPSPPCHS